jgi:hypothetical protein
MEAAITTVFWAIIQGSDWHRLRKLPAAPTCAEDVLMACGRVMTEARLVADGKNVPSAPLILWASSRVINVCGARCHWN